MPSYLLDAEYLELVADHFMLQQADQKSSRRSFFASINERKNLQIIAN
jgi:hypothetical protein